MLVLSTMAIACSRSGGSGDSTRLDTGVPDSTRAAPAAFDSAGAPATPPSSGTPAAGGGSGGEQRPSPSSPPNDVRPSIPRDGKVAPPSLTATDTVRGKPETTGTSRFTQVSITTSSGAVVRLGGAQAPIVGRLAGADVWVSGTRDANGVLVVEQFVVRSVDGRPARDGILGRDGDSYYLRMADGSRQPVVNPPADLREHVGDRVWVSGAAGAPPVSYGVVEVRK